LALAEIEEKGNVILKECSKDGKIYFLNYEDEIPENIEVPLRAFIEKEIN
jgi:hypothetical protein